jgi:hypothetical protein
MRSTRYWLAKDTPAPRRVQAPDEGRAVAFLDVGGLHRCYERRAADVTHVTFARCPTSAADVRASVRKPASLVAHGIAIVGRPALETAAIATEQRRRSFGEGQAWSMDLPF